MSGKVIVGGGTFNIAAPIVGNKADLNLSGLGWSSVLKAVAGLNNNIISVTTRPITIEFLKIDGNSANQASGNGIDVGVYSRRSKIHDVYLSYIKDVGIKTHGDGMDLNMSAIQADYCGTALDLGGSGGFLVFDLYASECIGVAVKISSIWVNLCGIRLINSERGILVAPVAPTNYVSQVTISNGDIDSQSKNAIEIYAETGYVDLVNIAEVEFGENSSGNVGVYSDIYVHRAGANEVRSLLILGNTINSWHYAKNSVEIGAGVSGSVSDNTIVPPQGNPAVVAPSTVKVHHNDGWVTEANLLSDTFAIDSTGIKYIVVPHGLSKAPARHQIQAQVLQNTGVTDWAYDFVMVYYEDATYAYVMVKVSTASATAGATARLGVRILE